MPTASERARQRTARAAQKRRMSLPSTAPSSTKVNPQKVQRRLSIRQSSISSLKENESPSKGPTPYWQVAEQRGGASPPETRSAKKKKKTGVLVFSPPNQEENARQEALAKADLEERFRQGVQQRQARGDLLLFSPSGRPLTELPLSDRKPPAVEAPAPPLPPSASSSSLSSDPLSQQRNDDITKELKTLQQVMEALGSKMHNDEGTKQLVLDMHAKYTENQTRLESKNDELSNELKALQEQWRGEKEVHLVAVTRLQAEVSAQERQAAAQVSILQQVQSKLETQLHELRASQTMQQQTVHELEQQLMAARADLATSQEQLQAMRLHAEQERLALEANGDQLRQANVDLQAQLESMRMANMALERQMDEHQRMVTTLEKERLPALQAQLEMARGQVEAKDDAIEGLQQKIAEYQAVVDELTEETKALNQENETQRLHFQDLNENSSKAYEKMMQEAKAKDKTIGNLYKQLGDLQNDMQAKQDSMHETTLQLEAMQQELASQKEQLNNALEETMNELEECEKAKAALEKRLSQVEAELVQEREDRLKAEQLLSVTEEQLQSAEEENMAARNNLEGLTDKEEALRQELLKMERVMKERDEQHRRERQMLEQERDDARNNMMGFGEREAELYRKLQECDRIRRNLHSRVMQLAGNIRVFVRVRPALPSEEAAEAKNASSEANDSKKRKRENDSDDDSRPFKFPGVYDRVDKKNGGSSSADDLTKNLIVATEPWKDRGGLSDRRKQWKFGFDNVFSPQHGQEDIWEATEPLVQSAVDGYNVCISTILHVDTDNAHTLFCSAYGQTGSGKTYTMLGDEKNEGIIGRAVKMLFKNKAEIEELSRGESKVSLSVELLEVYNEQVRDLLAPGAGPNGREVPLKVTSKEVVGNIKVDTESDSEVMRVLSLAQSRRCVKATESNTESSRSHMVFTIHFNVTTKDGSTRTGKLHVCDLAGSERLGKSGAHHVGGALLKETQNINKSLSVLSNVIERLQAGDKNIPFRESKLTFLLQNSLGGNSKTLAIVCCNPLASHFHESLCSLRFAEKVNKVDLKAVANFTC